MNGVVFIIYQISIYRSILMSKIELARDQKACIEDLQLLLPEMSAISYISREG